MWSFWSHQGMFPLLSLGFGSQERAVPGCAHTQSMFTKKQRGSWPCLQRGPKGRLMKSPGILTTSMPAVYSFLFHSRNGAFSHLTCSWLQKGLQLFPCVAEVPKDTQHGWQLPGGLAPPTVQLSGVYLETTLFQQIFPTLLPPPPCFFFPGTLWSQNFYV